MKKAKMLLSAIAVLAVVGGALAFKANTKFRTDYCTTNVDPGTANKCSILLEASTTTTSSTPDQFWYTIKPSNGCSNLPCNPSTFFEAD
jgi:hypothetical protein